MARTVKVVLRIGHRANTCDTTKKCRHCSGQQHQSICNNPSNNRQQCDDKKVPENQNSNKGPEGSLNPADLPSHGISAQELSNKSLWFKGPEFFVNDEDQWPKCPATNKPEPDEVLREVAKQPSKL
ncbi:Hypothetical predicted protein [Paramuricea clavata]|uniref:Uncharacterized protein n=1 Tax=Paramuricea clavata TaxID=317549 RepID=A0A6S7I678_PARCT|nr:Hypothetical predicted protein [Paramuricea clavata]